MVLCMCLKVGWVGGWVGDAITHNLWGEWRQGREGKRNPRPTIINSNKPKLRFHARATAVHPPSPTAV